MISFFIFTFFIFISSSSLFGAQQFPTTWLDIPGIVGTCDENIKILNPNAKIVGGDPLNPKWHDLGQSNCQQKVLDFVAQPVNFLQEKTAVHAASQGACTLLNLLSKEKVEPRLKNPPFILLDCPLVCPNSTIGHVIDNYETIFNDFANLIPWYLKKVKPLFKIVKNLPFKNYIAPYLAKIILPLYNPAAPNLLSSINNLKVDCPIIIMASTNDPFIPFESVASLYFLLKKKNHNVYLFLTNKKLHSNILQQLTKKERNDWVPAIKNIAQKK